MRTEKNDKCVIAFPEGKIDSSNAPDLQRELEAIRAGNAGCELILDAGGLEYISSAGLRVLLQLTRSQDKPLAVVNVTPAVYEIMEMTGFTELLRVKKAYRKLSVDGCEVIGRGYYGTIYRIDDETIVKVYRGKGSLPMIEKIVDDHTIVMSPMNGVDSEMVIGEVIGMEHVVYSLMRIASRRVGNEIRYDPEVTQGVYFGETDGTRSQRILDRMELFDDTPVRYSISSDIRQDIWYKYALNISKNIPQAIVGCGYGGYRDSSHLSYISDKMREEVAQVAWAKGIDIRDTDNPGAHNSPIPAEARFSTLQDLDAKRETEIEMFCGTLVRMGRELGIETPFNDFAYHVIRCLEEKNAGKLK